MLKRIMVVLLSIFFIACAVLGIVGGIYFLLPSQKAEASISLPDQVEDPKVIESETTEYTNNGYDNIYLADVHQSLTLRSQPDSSASSLADLVPMTKMQVQEFIEGTDFAYVEVINGTYQGQKGYVNKEYITRLGDPTIRVDNMDAYGNGE